MNTTKTTTAAKLCDNDSIIVNRLGADIVVTVTSRHNNGVGMIIRWVDASGLTGSSSFRFNSIVVFA